MALLPPFFSIYIPFNMKTSLLVKPILFFDLETTGLSITQDRIVELSFTKIMPDGERITRTRRLNPEIPIPAEASAVHGITDADVKDLSNFKAIASALAEHMKDCDLAGFNILGFDLPMLAEEFHRAGVEPPFNSATKIVDAKVIFHQYEKRDLSAAVMFYCGRVHEGAHSAEADVLSTIDVLEAQITKYSLPADVPSLHLLCEGDKIRVDYAGKFIKDQEGNILFNFGKHKGKNTLSEPSYLEWMINSGDFTRDTKYWCKRQLHLATEPLAY